MKALFRRILCIVLCLYSCISLANARFTIETDNLTVLNAIDFTEIDYNALCQVAENTLKYIDKHPEDHFAVHGGSSLLAFSDIARVKESLAFICKIHREDTISKQAPRLANREFLQQSFDFYRWAPDKETANNIAEKSTNQRKSDMLNAIPNDKIFLTKYYTKLLTGSAVKTAKYNQALYALPFDEQHLNKQEALKKKEILSRFRYTRQAILQGVLLNKKLAKPLVWVTEEALHDVLLQGTGVLNVDGNVRYFNVHRNNGIAYDYALGKREQARYWYFAEVPSILGYGQTITSKIAIQPQVSFAGNVKQLGLGQLFLVANTDIDKPFVRLGILADQGGAFDNNLFQLDLLVDSYQGWSDYHQHNKHLPDYNNAWLMLKKVN